MRTGDTTYATNPQTGKLDRVRGTSGNYATDKTKAFAVACAITHHRGKWIADGTGERGSRIYTVKNDTRATPSQIEAYALEALDPLVRSGEIQNPTATVSGPIGRRRLDVSYAVPNLGSQTVRVPL